MVIGRFKKNGYGGEREREILWNVVPLSYPYELSQYQGKQYEKPTLTARLASIVNQTIVFEDKPGYGTLSREYID